jgi:hypothetical protein
MGQSAVKKRQAASKARKAAKSASNEPSAANGEAEVAPINSVLPATATEGLLSPILEAPEVEEVLPPPPPLPRVKLLPPKALAPPISTRSHSRSRSCSGTSTTTNVIPSAPPLPLPKTDTSDISRPKRKSAEAVDKLMHQMRVNYALADDPSSSADASTAVDDSFEDESDEQISYGEEDNDELEYLTPPPPAKPATAPKPARHAAAPKLSKPALKAAPKAAPKRKKKVIEISDDEMSDDVDGTFAALSHLAIAHSSIRHLLHHSRGD